MTDGLEGGCACGAIRYRMGRVPMRFCLLVALALMLARPAAAEDRFPGAEWVHLVLQAGGFAP